MPRTSVHLRHWVRGALILVLLSLSLVFWTSSRHIEFLMPFSQTDGPPWVPAKGSMNGSRAEWVHRARRLHETRGSVPDPRIIFLGDSLTENWRFHGHTVWEQYYAHRQARNLGIWGDKTQHVLWRLKEFPIDRFHPEVVVVLIGVNNIPSDAPQDIVRGIAAVIQSVREQLPGGRILLLGLLPAGRDPRMRPAGIERVNEGLEAWARTSVPGLTYLDVGQAFLTPEGWIHDGYLIDEIHLSREGYRVWAEAMESTLASLLATPSEGPTVPTPEGRDAFQDPMATLGVDAPKTSSARIR